MGQWKFLLIQQNIFLGVSALVRENTFFHIYALEKILALQKFSTSVYNSLKKECKKEDTEENFAMAAIH